MHIKRNLTVHERIYRFLSVLWNWYTLFEILNCWFFPWQSIIICIRYTKCGHYLWKIPILRPHIIPRWKSFCTKLPSVVLLICLAKKSLRLRYMYRETVFIYKRTRMTKIMAYFIIYTHCTSTQRRGKL